MIDLYAWNTSNGRKVSILLEELEMPYRYHPIDINKGEQFEEGFQAINPNSKIPAIIDSAGPEGKAITLFESGAILIYLAEKARSPLWITDAHRQTQILQWLMFQMGNVGPTFGQALHFYRYAEQKMTYGIERYRNEVLRLLQVMDGVLEDRPFFAHSYSIADISLFPWVIRTEWLDVDLEAYPNLFRWFIALQERPAVQRGLKALDV
jgi:GST-like protein